MALQAKEKVVEFPYKILWTLQNSECAKLQMVTTKKSLVYDIVAQSLLIQNKYEGKILDNLIFELHIHN